MNLDSKKVMELERELSRIRNVSYASLVLDARHEIEQIDVLSDTQRPPRPIVRDVEAVLRRHGVQVDHRKIGVVQLNSPHNSPLPAHQPIASRSPWRSQPRIRLAAVHSTTSGGNFVAEVELSLGAFEGLPGRCEGPALDADACVALVARAAVQAVRNLLKPQYEIQLRTTRVASLAGGSLVIVVLDYGLNRQIQRLAGTCWDQGSLYESTVYACLDALNRPLGKAEFQDLMVQDEDATLEQISWRAASA
jgi:hypothetical protein